MAAGVGGVVVAWGADGVAAVGLSPLQLRPPRRPRRLRSGREGGKQWIDSRGVAVALEVATGFRHVSVGRSGVDLYVARPHDDLSYACGVVVVSAVGAGVGALS